MKIECTFGCVAHRAVLLNPNVVNIFQFNFCDKKLVQQGSITIAIDCNGHFLLIFIETLRTLTNILFFFETSSLLSLLVLFWPYRSCPISFFLWLVLQHYRHFVRRLFKRNVGKCCAAAIIVHPVIVCANFKRFQLNSEILA